MGRRRASAGPGRMGWAAPDTCGGSFQSPCSQSHKEDPIKNRTVAANLCRGRMAGQACCTHDQATPHPFEAALGETNIGEVLIGVGRW